MAKRPSSQALPARPRSAAAVAPSTPGRAKSAAIDPKPGAQADPRGAQKGGSGSLRGAGNHAPADLPQLDRDNRHRERINIPDSHKGATPKSDHKRNDRTPKRH
jgi:hypothetical protein